MKMFISRKDEGVEWISISDIMSVLMLIFMFIGIIYMRDVITQRDQIKEDKEKIERIAITYNRLQTQLYEALYNEFKDDLPKWDAELDRATLAIRFNEPDVLFPVGSTRVTSRFKIILDDFFPRYLDIISADVFKNDIEEIRIEGHTSSEWNYSVGEGKAYFFNMELSQGRTREVLNYCIGLIKPEFKNWAMQHFTANGLSSSKLIFNKDGTEDKDHSRRVEFRTRTNAEKQIMRILEEIHATS